MSHFLSEEADIISTLPSSLPCVPEEEYRSSVEGTGKRSWTVSLNKEQKHLSLSETLGFMVMS